MYQRKLKKIPDLTGEAFRTTTYIQSTHMCFLSFSISKYLKYVLKIGSTAKHEPVCLHVLHKRYAALVFFVLSKDGQLHCIYKTNVPTSHYRHVYFKVK